MLRQSAAAWVVMVLAGLSALGVAEHGMARELTADRAAANDGKLTFADLPSPVQQQLVAIGQTLPNERAQEFWQAVTAPGFIEITREACASLGPIQMCSDPSSEYLSFTLTPLRGGPGIKIKLDDNGELLLGVGQDVRSPTPLGLTGGIAAYENGNVEVSGGVAAGIPNVADTALQVNATIAMGRVEEFARRARQLQDARVREAAAAVRAQERERISRMSIEEKMQYLTDLLLPEDPSQAELEMRRDIAENAYNPPADVIAPYEAGQPRDRARLTMDDDPPPAGLSADAVNQAAFRAEIEQSMQQFRAEAARQERELRERPRSAPSTQPLNGRSPEPAATISPRERARTNSDVYAPRNGYDAYGNRTDSSRRQYDEQGYATDSARRQYDDAGYAQSPTRRQYDEQGYRVPPAGQRYQPRQNRVYDVYNNTSRPIGGNSIRSQYEAMQQWSNDQISAQQEDRYTGGSAGSLIDTGDSDNDGGSSNYTPSSTNDVAPEARGYGYDESSARGSQIVYDDSVPRSNGQPAAELANARADAREATERVRELAQPAAQLINEGNAPQSSSGQSAYEPSVPAVQPRETGSDAPTASIRLPR